MTSMAIGMGFILEQINGADVCSPDASSCAVSQRQHVQGFSRQWLHLLLVRQRRDVRRLHSAAFPPLRCAFVPACCWPAGGRASGGVGCVLCPSEDAAAPALLLRLCADGAPGRTPVAPLIRLCPSQDNRCRRRRVLAHSIWLYVFAEVSSAVPDDTVWRAMVGGRAAEEERGHLRAGAGAICRSALWIRRHSPLLLPIVSPAVAIGVN